MSPNAASSSAAASAAAGRSSSRRRARAASPSTSSASQRAPSRAATAWASRAAATVASRSPARRCASAEREAAIAAGYGRSSALPGLGRGDVERRDGLAGGARRVGGRARGVGGRDRQVEVLGDGLHARVHHLRAHPRAALGLRVAEVAGALGGVGLDADADAGDLREPLAVLAAELDPVDRLLDDRAGGVEVAVAALELAAQRAAARQILRLEREREDAGGLLEQRPRRARVAAAEQQPGARDVEVGERRTGEAATVREVRLGGVPVAERELDLRALHRQPARGARAAGQVAPRRRSRPPGPRGCDPRGAARRRGWPPRTRRRSPRRRRSRDAHRLVEGGLAALVLAERVARDAEPVEDRRADVVGTDRAGGVERLLRRVAAPRRSGPGASGTRRGG